MADPGSELVKIIFIDADGGTRECDGEIGKSVMETAVNDLVEGIVAECGGYCSCATCHAYVDPAWMDRLPAPEMIERDMLDGLLNVRPNSRLTCQLKVTEDLDGIVFTAPASQY